MSLHNPAANMGDAHDSYQRADPSTSPTQNGYEELFGDTVPCPTCRGTGRLPKDNTSSQGNTPKKMKQEQDSDVSIEPEIYQQIRTEIKEERISQDVFAGVALGRTQGHLSELLRRGEAGIKVNQSTRQNLQAIQKFLWKPVSERRKLYEEYRMQSKTKRRLRKEYFEDESGSVPKKRKVISAHAKGVMLEYYEQVSDTPDQAGLNVMSNVLNLDKKIVKKFLKNERLRREQLHKANEEDDEDKCMAEQGETS